MSVWPAWEVQEHDGATSWFHVRLAFPDGARVDALAVVCEQTVSVEDVRAQPALSLDDLTLLADWLEGPLFEACGVEPAPVEGEEWAESGGARRARRPGRVASRGDGRSPRSTGPRRRRELIPSSR